MSNSRHALWRYRLVDLLPLDEYDVLSSEWACDSSESLGSLLGNLTLINSQRRSFPVYHQEQYIGEMDLNILANWIFSVFPDIFVTNTSTNIQKHHDFFNRTCLLCDHPPYTPDISHIHMFFKNHNIAQRAFHLQKKFSWVKFGEIALTASVDDAFQHYLNLFASSSTALHYKLNLECPVYTYFLLLAQDYQYIPIQLHDGKIFSLDYSHCLHFLQSNASEIFAGDIHKSVEELNLISKAVETSIHASLGSSIMVLAKNHVDSIAIIDANGKLGGRFTLQCLLEVAKKLIHKHWPEHEDDELPSLSDLRELIRYGYRFCFNKEKADFEVLNILGKSLDQCGEVGVTTSSFKDTMVIQEDDDNTSISSIASDSGIGSSDDDYIDQRKTRVLQKIQKTYNR